MVRLRYTLHTPVPVLDTGYIAQRELHHLSYLIIATAIATMQRKALKQVCLSLSGNGVWTLTCQLGKVTQWTNEKVFSGEKTQLSSEFTQFEKDIEIKKNGIERYVIYLSCLVSIVVHFPARHRGREVKRRGSTMILILD